ncbi:MAG: flagellar assembly protein FliH, partial [Stenotrophomonas nitritireducens]|nr:flagellar assembly protein FliH [Stenotrophomonas nitritireducens]
GDLRVHAESVRIDGTLDARLRAALSTVMRKAGATQ